LIFSIDIFSDFFLRHSAIISCLAAEIFSLRRQPPLPPLSHFSDTPLMPPPAG
jgi:hypothetical protein